jgi:hypothetical protein
MTGKEIQRMLKNDPIAFMCCRYLPREDPYRGWTIKIDLEQGAGTCRLYDPYNRLIPDVHFQSSADMTFFEQVMDRVNYAMRVYAGYMPDADKNPVTVTQVMKDYNQYLKTGELSR